jgi:surface antigen
MCLSGVIMRWSGSTYIGEGRLRQSPPLVRPTAIAVVAAALCGCAGLGLPFGEAAVDRNLTTGSIEKVSSKGPDKVAQSDWEAVRQSIAHAAAEDALSQALAWRNPETGTTGTLTVLDTVTATNDPNCRNFQTTVNDTRGIRHYRGEACRMSKDSWELFGVLADDSKLL